MRMAGVLVLVCMLTKHERQYHVIVRVYLMSGVYLCADFEMHKISFFYSPSEQYIALTQLT